MPWIASLGTTMMRLMIGAGNRGWPSRYSAATLRVDRAPKISSPNVLSGRVEATRSFIIRLIATTAIRNFNKILIGPTSHKIATTMHDPCQAR